MNRDFYLKNLSVFLSLTSVVSAVKDLGALQAGSMKEDTHSIVPNPQSPIVNRLPSTGGQSPPVVDADWVQGYRPRRLGRWRHWLGALGKLIIGCGIAAFLLWLPAGNLPTLLQTWKNPVVIFLFVCFIGKLMYDTFFYDHFQF